MKIKAITSVTELKSGLYLKAFVNYVGQYMVMVERVVGKPYKKNESEWSKNLWRVQTKWSSGKRYEQFVGDLIGHNSDIATATLLPYSAKMETFLSSAGRFQFLEIINGRKLSPEEKVDFLFDWELQQHLDKEMDTYYDDYDDYENEYDR